MEIKVNEVAIPDAIQFNYDELKQELTEKVNMYESIVYTDEQINQAKKDKASLNKLKKALNDERIRREKEYLQPFNEFKTKINEIISIIDKPVAVIDKQVKEYEEKQKADKKATIIEHWESIEDKPEWLTFDSIFDSRWLLSGTSMRSIKDNINGILNSIKENITTLESLPEFSFEATEEYKRTLDINKAIAEGKRLADIQKRKEEDIQKRKEAPQIKLEEHMTPPVEEQKQIKEDAQWISFSACLTVPQALELKEFFNSRNIDFKAI